MKIVILGANGMLGRYLTCYLGRKHNVIPFERKDVDASVEARQLRPHIPIFSRQPDVVVNCIGVIKSRMNLVGIQDAIVVNSVFPRILADECQKRNVKLIHVSTDCVFSGMDGSYAENSFHDALDEYGKTKSLGEPENCTTIRTSIVGEEFGQGRSLLNWAISQKGKTIDGFVNHYWNGITCLQFAKIVQMIVEQNLFWTGVRHIHSPHYYSKFGMLNIFNKIYNLELNIDIVNTEKIDRTLKTNFPELLKKFNIPDFEDQVVEMKEFRLL